MRDMTLNRRMVLQSAAFAALVAAIKAPSALAADGTPVRGGTMVVALGGNPDHLNLGISSSVIVAMPAQAVIEGLIQLDGNFSAQPVLASSWDISEDSTVYKFNLRQGVKWHDGKDFTSDDVVYSLKTIAPLNPRAAAVFANVESIEASDKQTVTVKLKKPFGPFLLLLTSDNVAILPKHLYEGSDPLSNPANLSPVGTGPFKFDSWASGQSITLTRNENYWDAGKPYLDRIVFGIMPDANSRMLALESGEVDIVTNYDISVKDIARIRKLPGVTLLQQGVPRPLLLIFNSKNEYLSKPEVRKALFRATNRNTIVSNAFAGEGELGHSAIPPGIAWAYNPDVDYMKTYAFDPAAANAELDSAGLKRGDDGTRFSVRFIYDPAQSGFAEVGEILRSNWAEIGVKVELEARERNVWLDAVFKKKDFDTTIAFYFAGVDPAFGVDRAYRCADIREAAFTNGSQYCSEKLDALLDSARTTADVSARKKAYYEAQVLIAGDLPTAVLIDSPKGHAIRDDIGNIDKLFALASETNLRFADAFKKQ